MPDQIFPDNVFDARIISVDQHANGILFITLVPSDIKGSPSRLTPRENFSIDQRNHSGIIGVALAAYLNNLTVRVLVNPNADERPGGVRVITSVAIRQEGVFPYMRVAPVGDLFPEPSQVGEPPSAAELPSDGIDKPEAMPKDTNPFGLTRNSVNLKYSSSGEIVSPSASKRSEDYYQNLLKSLVEELQNNIGMMAERSLKENQRLISKLAELNKQIANDHDYE